MPHPSTKYYRFWTPSPNIIRFSCTRLTQGKQPSLPHTGLYCYNVMPFGLKNVEATYHRMVTKIFRPLLGNTMEAYIDNMLVKSKEHFDHAKNIQEAFDLLRRYGMKLNPLKCAFEVSASKFLVFMVTQRGIEANLIQLKAIMNSYTLTFKKGV